ncbi:MAG: type II toxin-antitoxin system VapC family toxin [Candidatus Nanohalobium sp.]
MIVDTDMLIDYLRGKERGTKLLEHYKPERSVETTGINVFELYHGAYKSENSTKQVSNLKGFLNRIRVHETSEDSMELAGKIAAELETEGEKIGAKDVLISGIALLENQPVLTYNKKHFKKVEELELLETEINK